MGQEYRYLLAGVSAQDLIVYNQGISQNHIFVRALTEECSASKLPLVHKIPLAAVEPRTSFRCSLLAGGCSPLLGASHSSLLCELPDLPSHNMAAYFKASRRIFFPVF